MLNSTTRALARGEQPRREPPTDDKYADANGGVRSTLTASSAIDDAEEAKKRPTMGAHAPISGPVYSHEVQSIIREKTPPQPQLNKQHDGGGAAAAAAAIQGGGACNQDTREKSEEREAAAAAKRAVPRGDARM